ncbi:MAG: hypothetical protein KJ767_04180 [Nanoarchaeota archaeon]|nr:hypothetical protein [Nanoarchaeota archaeon]
MALENILSNILFVCVGVVLILLLLFGQGEKLVYIIAFVFLILGIIISIIGQKNSRERTKKLIQIMNDRTRRMKTFEAQLNKSKKEIESVQDKIKKAT